ncbi:MAG TPA: protein translocase subunit SecD [Myxococcota bacterium]|nr:protein translocase subunit SecD [Myxococcota bacterium]
MTLRSRWIMIGAVTVMMVWLALPSFLPAPKAGEEHWWLPKKGMRLGLDLQGGIHWLLRVDQDAAVKRELEKVQSSIADAASDGKIELKSGEVKGDQLFLHGDVPGLRKLVEANAPNVDVDEEEGALVLKLKERWKRDAVERGAATALEVLRRRVDSVGVSEPIIAPQGNGRILVQMPGMKDPAAARQLIQATTFLEFKLVLDAAPNEEVLKAKYPKGIPDDQEIVTNANEGRKGKESEALLVPKKAVLSGDMLEDARMSYDRRNRPIIEFTWNSEGAKVFRDFTGQNIGHRLAAIIDGKVITAPTIQSKIGRNGEITGDFTRDEANNTAVQLRSGALPIPLVLEEERSVGPSLGADSIRDGVHASLVGAGLVFLFMGIYYSVTGMFANLALVVNVVILIGLMSSAGATMTLPGIAGVVLTVGMAVDSNVIIYERIREELRSGKTPRAAIGVGYARSFWTIFDAHVTALLSSVILFLIGRGPVQGFGVTLTIGLLASMFTALVVTRTLMDTVYGNHPERLRI